MVRIGVLPSKRLAVRGSFLAVATLGILLGGCAPLNVRGDPFARDETFESVGSVRKPDQEIDYFGVSTKARQIERHLGAP